MSESPVDEIESIVQPTTENPSSRMHYRGIGDLMFPGSCCVCGNGTNQAGYVDIGVYYEYEGQVYLCLDCVTEAAETGGMLSLEVSNHLKELATQVAEDNKALRQLNLEMSERLGHYDSLLGDRIVTIDADGTSNVSVPSGDDVSGESSDTGVTDDSSDEPSRQGKSDKSKPAKSGSGKIVTGVSVSTGSD